MSRKFIDNKQNEFRLFGAVPSERSLTDQRINEKQPECDGNQQQRPGREHVVADAVIFRVHVRGKPLMREIQRYAGCKQQ